MSAEQSIARATLLEIEDLHVAYTNREILRGVSLVLQQGEMLALLGGNGSGKSTLLKAIAGLLQPVSGRIELNGFDITGVRSGIRHSKGLGYVMQGGRVFPNSTVAENFEVAVRHARAQARFREPPTLGMLFPELRDYAHLRAGLLSGGHRQMLAIELVFSQYPELVLLDEPTGGLAPDLASRLLKIIHNWCFATNCGVLLVEQNADRAKQSASKIHVLRHGRIQ